MDNVDFEAAVDDVRVGDDVAAEAGSGDDVGDLHADGPFFLHGDAHARNVGQPFDVWQLLLDDGLQAGLVEHNAGVASTGGVVGVAFEIGVEREEEDGGEHAAERAEEKEKRERMSEAAL